MIYEDARLGFSAVSDFLYVFTITILTHLKGFEEVLFWLDVLF